FDQPVTLPAPLSLSTTFVLGRLSQVVSPTETITFGYDGLGRPNVVAFADDQGGKYLEKSGYHGDGSLASLDFVLPDSSFKDERVEYGYDSAGRVRSVNYTGVDRRQRQLFAALSSGDIDGFGRIRQALYGPARFTAAYADLGRRLLQDMKITSGDHSRE